MATGRVNPKRRLEDQGIAGLGEVHYNLPEPALVEPALLRGEGRLGHGGALLVATGKHTGRSPKDKHVVRTPSVENTIWWENNRPMTPEGFDRAPRRHAGAHEGARLLRAGPLRAAPTPPTGSTCAW